MFTGAGYSNENPDVLHQFPEAVLPGKPLMIVLPMARCWSILFKPFCNVLVEVFVNQFHDQPTPVFRSLSDCSFPVCEACKFNPQFIGKSLFPFTHLVFKVCPLASRAAHQLPCRIALRLLRRLVRQGRPYRKRPALRWLSLPFASSGR